MSVAAAESIPFSSRIESIYASLKVSGSLLELKGGISSASATPDSLTISQTAREMTNRLKELDVFSCIFPDADPRRTTKTLEEVESDFQGDFASFASMFAKLSSMISLDSGQSFAMGLDGVGGMIVDGTGQGGEGMATRLEGLFNNNQTLVSRFAVMAARAALADAADTVAGFRSAYESDPVAAVKDNIDGLKERLLGFRTLAGEETVHYGFMRGFELEIAYSAASLASSAAGTAEWPVPEMPDFVAGE
ncbi:MAG: hypothetical protein LBE84_11125 [Planctomycetota bacterium]|nr:hypothetical protein [Planctomycetota bacterium]